MTFRFEGEYAEFEKILRGTEISEDEKDIKITALQFNLDHIGAQIKERDKFIAECTEEIRGTQARLRSLSVELEEKDAGLKAKDDQIAQLMRRLGQA